MNAKNKFFFFLKTKFWPQKKKLWAEGKRYRIITDEFRKEKKLQK